MEILNAYFDKLVFVKIEQKENFTIYAAALSSSFGDNRKTYALAFVPVHMAILDKGFLRDLHWQNFQTRTLNNGWKIPNQRWDMRNLKGLPTPMFNAVERNEARTKYICESEPLEMVLLHDPKKKSVYQYHSRINLLAALATFKCVLNFVEGHEMQATRNLDNTLARNPPDPSMVPISSLAIPMPRQSPVYRASELSEDTSYVPRSEGTRYVATGTESSGYEFNNSTVIGNTGYRNLSLDITVPDGPSERENNHSERSLQESRHHRENRENIRENIRENRGQRVRGVRREQQEQIDDSFELL